MMFRDNDHSAFMDTVCHPSDVGKWPLNWEHNCVAPIKVSSIRQSSGKCDAILGQAAGSLSMYRVVPLGSSAAVCECPWQPQASTAILHSHHVPKKKKK